ncbi:MAG TPA: VOC family protein [Acidobacteriaceae bacterium]|jgi:glyoxylase I family protein
MKIKLTSIMVEDQDKALAFYTQVLGFTMKHEIPMGPYRWLTVVSPDEPNGAELSLEPNANPDGRKFQQAMFAQKIPVAAFEVGNLNSEVKKLRDQGVVFVTEPFDAGGVHLAILSDTCGNLIQLYQPKADE